MKFDVTVLGEDLTKIPDIAKQIEGEYGFDGFWTAEANHNPFLPIPLAVHFTERIEIGTAIAVAFPRSPMVTAQIAWDLAKQSHGRFMLGLGTQVRAHIVKRFSSTWTGKPVSQMREYIQAMRAVWAAFQGDGRLRYIGEVYNLGLMTPFFNPGPIDHPKIPVYIAGVNKGLCKFAGEMCDGFHAHPFHTQKYLQEVTIKYITEGAEANGRSRNDVMINCPVFVVTGTNAEEMEASKLEAKSQIAFYASTPSYRAVLELHGWGELGETLSSMARGGQWGEMHKQISDEMLDLIALVGAPDEIPHMMKERYDGILDRTGYYMQFNPDKKQELVIWEEASKVFGT